MSDSPLPVGIEHEYPNAFTRLIDDFYHSNHDLLLEGMRSPKVNTSLFA